MLETIGRNPERLGREQTMEITEEVDVDHSNFKQNVAEKEHLVI